jgi:hypothetical protein
MDWESIKSSIQWFSPIIGGAIVWLYTQWEKKKKLRKEEEKTIAEREQTYSQLIESRNKVLLEENEALRKKILDIQLNSMNNRNLSVTDILKELIDSDPGVSWVKIRVTEHLYRIVRVSPSYARLYLVENPEYYDNKTMHDIYGKDLGEQYSKDNEIIYRNQEGVHVKNKVLNAPSGIKGHFVGRKYPIYIEGDHNYIFVSGYHENDDGTIQHGGVKNNPSDVYPSLNAENKSKTETDKDSTG